MVQILIVEDDCNLNEIVSKQKGFEIGTDDYMVEPVNFRIWGDSLYDAGFVLWKKFANPFRLRPFTGLGMALVKKAMEVLQGTIESETVYTKLETFSVEYS